MIPHNKIAEVKEISILEVASRYGLEYKRSGATFKSLCPFHEEKTASFILNPNTNRYKCFGCGEGGNVIDLVMKLQCLDFTDAVRDLGRNFGIDLAEYEPTEEQLKVIARKNKLLSLHELAQKEYEKNLGKDSNVKALLEQRIGARHNDMIFLFGIGLATAEAHNFVDYAKKEGYSGEDLLRSGLAASGNYGLYDRFFHRVTFPIYNGMGEIVAFSGRTLEEGDKAKKVGKYLNSNNTELYKKDEHWFGWLQARKEIARREGAVIVEGNFDVVRMHSVGVTNTVATCGTSLSDSHLQMLKRSGCKTVTLIYDGDTAGRAAGEKNGRKCVEFGLNTYVIMLEDGEDPDVFFKDVTEAGDYIESHRQDYIIHYAACQLAESEMMDVIVTDTRITNVANLLRTLKNKSKVENYVEFISSAHGFKSALFRNKIRDLEQNDNAEERGFKLPAGVSSEEFRKYGFYEDHNEYIFAGKYGTLETFSNFVMRPLFHIIGMDSRRIYELINKNGQKKVVNLDTKAMTSISVFKQNIEGLGNFLILGTENQMNRLKLKLYEDTISCEMINVMGWNSAGFWAWGNGIYIPNENLFKNVDADGLVVHQGQHYFIPAFSSIYQADKSILQKERNFIYKEGHINFEQWSKMFSSVFGVNGRIALCHYLSTCFRDWIFEARGKEFPLLNLFGPKGTGKSQMAVELMKLFGLNQDPINLANCTLAGLSEYIREFSNAYAFLDEYKNCINIDKIEFIKGVYGGLGRNRVNMDKGGKRETTQVNSAVIVAGQEMMSLDVAAFSRVIFLDFNCDEYSKEQVDRFAALKSKTKEGLSHITQEVVAHRQEIEDQFQEVYTKSVKDIQINIEGMHVDTRLVGNISILLAVVRILGSKLKLPFTQEQIEEELVSNLKSQMLKMKESDDLTAFWDTFQSLVEQGILVSGYDYRIEMRTKIKTNLCNLEIQEPKQILFVKFAKVYSLYARNMTGAKPLPKGTLEYYLKSAKYTYGVASSIAFKIKNEKTYETERHITSAYAFDYEAIGCELHVFAESKDFRTYEEPPAEPVVNRLPFAD